MSAAVSAVLPQPAAPPSAAPAAPPARRTRATVPAAAPADSRVSARSPKLPQLCAALSDAADSAAPKAAASRSGSAPATPRLSPPAAPLLAPPNYSPSKWRPPHLVFLSEITFHAAPHRHILVASFSSAYSVSCVQMLFHFFNASILSALICPPISTRPVTRIARVSNSKPPKRS
jgi:hypothetical protein